MPDGPLRYTQYDTAPPIEEVLEERNDATGAWAPMDLSGKTVRLLGEHRRSGRRFGGVVTADAGSQVSYHLAPTDLSETDSYWYEWEVTAPNGDRRTIPGGELIVSKKRGAVAA